MSSVCCLHAFLPTKGPLSLFIRCHAPVAAGYHYFNSFIQGLADRSGRRAAEEDEVKKKKGNMMMMRSSIFLLLSLALGTVCVFSGTTEATYSSYHPKTPKAPSLPFAYCKDPHYWRCVGIPHTCPPGCPKQCEVDCKLCKPYCACDKPGAVCQDPRFIGGDGITFYFHGRKDMDFCLVSDSDVHINGHFIGKRSPMGRDFTWVQSIGVLFGGGHQLYLGAKKVSQWNDLDDNLLIQLDGVDVEVPSGESAAWTSPEAAGLVIRRTEEENEVVAEVADSFSITARVVPITEEESRVHGYDIPEDDCFAHLELGFKFSTLSAAVDGVLGQTYVPGYQSRVKIGAAMPVMGGAEKYSSSHLFATDCSVSRFGVDGGEELSDLPAMACGTKIGGGNGIVCRK